jgi:putative MATE family efflux protein
MDKNRIDMLHGPLLGKIMSFALPFAVSSILQQLFNSVDVAVVGRFASSEALAAVGANTFLINLMLNLFLGISIGANVVIANLIGQRDGKRIRKAVGSTMVIALVCGCIMLMVGLAIARPVLEWMGTPQNILDDAVLYLRIYFLGVPCFMVYNFGASILRSKGDTKRPLYILVIAGVINAMLNLLFVIVFRMSVAGVAIATGIANLFSAVVIIYLLKHEKMPFRLRWRYLSLDRQEVNRILQIGIPAGLQTMVFSLSNVFVQTSINTYGSSAIAGASISQMFDYYCYFLMVGFSSAAVTFVGQNYGAGRIDRCKRIFWICLGGGALACLAGNLLFILGSDSFVSIFSEDREVARYAMLRMSTVLWFQWMAAGYEIPASAMRGFGHSMEPALITIFGTCVFRLVWIFTIVPVWIGFQHLMMIYPISWIFTVLLMVPVYIWQSRKAFARF